MPYDIFFTGKCWVVLGAIYFWFLQLHRLAVLLLRGGKYNTVSLWHTGGDVFLAVRWLVNVTFRQAAFAAGGGAKNTPVGKVHGWRGAAS